MKLILLFIFIFIQGVFCQIKWATPDTVDACVSPTKEECWALAEVEGVAVQQYSVDVPNNYDDCKGCRGYSGIGYVLWCEGDKTTDATNCCVGCQNCETSFPSVCAAVAPSPTPTPPPAAKLNKMNVTLFYVILLGGLPVVFSYYILSMQPESNQLLSGVQGWMYYAWLVSMMLTIISYLYLGYMFIWGIKDAYVFEWTGAEIEPWLCSLYTLFLGSASQYAFIALLALKNKEKSVYLSINLWLTAFASLLIGASAVAINGVSDLHNILSIIAGFIIALHHIFFDAIYWLQTFEPKYSELV